MQDFVTITLKTSSKAGALASIILKANTLGLKYKKNLNDQNDDLLILFFAGVPSCSKNDLKEIFEALPKVDAVENIIIDQEYDQQHNAPNETSLSSFQSVKLNAQENISSKALKIAEEKLTEYMGLVAPMLVEAASKKTQDIGQLFLLLAKELEGDEREAFLSEVQGLHS